MPPVGFEPMISAGELPQTYALDRVATGTGDLTIIANINRLYSLFNSFMSLFPCIYMVKFFERKK